MMDRQLYKFDDLNNLNYYKLKSLWALLYLNINNTVDNTA